MYNLTFCLKRSPVCTVEDLTVNYVTFGSRNDCPEYHLGGITCRRKYSCVDGIRTIHGMRGWFTCSVNLTATHNVKRCNRLDVQVDGNILTGSNCARLTVKAHAVHAM